MIPIRTNIRPWRTPYANYALVAANVCIFLVTFYPHRDPLSGAGEYLRGWAERFVLDSGRPAIWQFVSYAFLHGGFLHIAGNMFFLYLFGNNVNDKLGHIGYVCFYLAGAVFSGLGHLWVGGGNVIGASGAVAAVTGAYLVLFPRSLITVVYWFFLIGTMELPALYFIIFKLILIDNIISTYVPDVAYNAHLAGYGLGMVTMLGLLATGLVGGSTMDLWYSLKQWNRRRRYRDAASNGYEPFEGRKVRAVRAGEIKAGSKDSQYEQKITQLRAEIGTRIGQRNLPAAAESYLALIATDSGQIVPRQHLLDIANQLASEGKHGEAADAYEKFLKYYSGYEHAEQVELMLGILYGRYLDKPEQARKHLQTAADKLSDPAQIEMCKEELQRLSV